jgi:hypothetical protein
MESETAQERKLRLTHEAQKGREAEELLVKFGDTWITKAGKKNLRDLLRAETAEDLLRVQANYRAATDIYGKLKMAVRKGKKAAETLHEEAMRNG